MTMETNKKDTQHSTSDFDEYLRQGEPDKLEKANNWQAAIGLQAVDGLHTSDYLLQTARQHIEGKIDIDTAQKLLLYMTSVFGNVFSAIC